MKGKEEGLKKIWESGEKEKETVWKGMKEI